MNNFQKLLEKMHLLWVPVIGLAFISYGIYDFFETSAKEVAGEPVNNGRLRFLYDFGGKYAILGLFLILGIICVVVGIKQLKSKD